MQPLETIQQAFLQLTFAIKLLNYVEIGGVSKSDFDTDTLILLKKRNIPFPSGTFQSDNDIILAAENNCTITFGFSAIVLNQALSDAGFPSEELHKLPPDATPHWDLRALVYMIRCAFAHDMMRPRWKVQGPFARELKVKLPSGLLIVDTSKLSGQLFADSHIGGYETYFEIKGAVDQIVSKP